ncbi:hypothetical protein GCM10010992_01710 [Cloacibacterium rupense]|uniref:Uncharacterized protein n=1 Tax=Cloacibacterium rupense TaxID=517423 RepID=A0ABQ2NF95_9FLAO|nr:hypothetical protein GCM10010992_01710 [Cloacibacterium rupense]
MEISWRGKYLDKKNQGERIKTTDNMMFVKKTPPTHIQYRFWRFFTNIRSVMGKANRTTYKQYL